MNTIILLMTVGLFFGVLLAFMVWIIPDKKLRYIEKWIKAYRGNCSD